MIGLEQIVGQRAALDVLRRVLEADRVPHALLFSGPEGVGKMTVARAFCRALLCETGRGCASCASCRLFEHGNHLDLMSLGLLPRRPGPTGDLRKFILVEQIRELAGLAAQTPRQGRRRVFLIDPADRMNLSAQNALLKTLEEPPGRAVLILVASRPHLLLPTVRSRCFGVRFAALRASELAAWLKQRGEPGEEAAARAALADGRPGRALGLELDELRDRREELLSMLETLSASTRNAGDLPEMAAGLAGKDETALLDSLELLEGLLRDAARAALGGNDAALIHADLSPRLERLGSRMGSLRAALLVSAIERLRGDLRFNVNRLLVAESLLAAVAGGPVP